MNIILNLSNLFIISFQNMSQSGNNGSLGGKSAVHKEMKERYLSA
jgi:ankyrin repeat protein